VPERWRITGAERKTCHDPNRWPRPPCASRCSALVFFRCGVRSPAATLLRTARIPDGKGPRNISTAQILEHGNRGSEDACQSRVIPRGRVAIRSATRPGDRSEPSLSDQLSCQPRTAQQSTAQNRTRTRTRRSGTRTRRDGARNVEHERSLLPATCEAPQHRRAAPDSSTSTSTSTAASG